MTEDVDMDAPQISTLHDEASPEPRPAPSKFRVKLLVNNKSESSKAGSVSSKHGRADSDDDDDDDEDEEEDQLIDDDDDEAVKPAPAIPAQVTAPVAATPPKRGGRGRGGGRGGRGRGRGRAGAQPVPGPGVTWFETAPSEATSSQVASADVWDPSIGAGGSPAAQAPARKKPGPPKGSQRGGRKKAPKIPKTAVSMLKDDIDTASEAYGTAASSPVPHDGSPEPDIPLSHIAAMHHAMDDAPLEGVPLPVYPLPSKPFPVQPPPKMGTGFAPSIPLDKSGKPVRKWRQVHREVRGIAGGRWFVKSWVGEKESDFANAVAASQAAAQALGGDGMSGAGLTLPTLSGVSISGTGRGRGRGARHGVAHSSTVASSRAGSAMPESISAQLKKRSGPSTPSVDLPTPIPISTAAVP
ncbi:hypothetical protein K466DRAFT_571453 [Polyporus arcularius HHB13444]|uniref:Uncharacterized protein n=1 Tax=Polyporus arcularius HHB13444 TaxID=1314778 RepID=A0A5C3PYQ9_9APHY|nr:hypothetical protein K466DRAFT_571453 [Polyporus arcularius HHB13444]